MTPKPTNDEVEWIKLQALTWLDKYDADILVNLCNAYLAQEGDLKRLENLVVSYGELVRESNEQGFKELQRIGELKAENQALRDELKRLNQYIEQMERQQLAAELDALQYKGFAAKLKHWWAYFREHWQ